VVEDLEVEVGVGSGLEISKWTRNPSLRCKK